MKVEDVSGADVLAAITRIKLALDRSDIHTHRLEYRVTKEEWEDIIFTLRFYGITGSDGPGLDARLVTYQHVTIRNPTVL